MSSRVLRNLLILVGISAVMACAKSEPPALPVPEVTVSNPVVRDVQRFVEFNGTTIQVESVEIRARVMGVLESIEFAPGSLVKEGQLLFVIEREQYRALRDQAKAALLSSQAELASARSDEERIQNAIQNNAVSKQDLDQAIARRSAPRRTRSEPRQGWMRPSWTTAIPRFAPPSTARLPATWWTLATWWARAATRS